MDEHSFAPEILATIQNRRLLKSCASALALYGGATVLCLALLIWVLRLWEADLTVPYNYGGDALCMLSWIKGIIDHGWYLHNESLGAPFGQDMHDFPMADNLHFLLLKGIALAFPDAAVTFNLYLLLTFPLTTVATLFVLRRLGVSRSPAIMGSLLYTFLAYHLLRGMGQLFLAGYYLVPFIVFVLLRVCREEEGLFRSGQPGRSKRVGFIPKALSYCAICLLVSSAGVYYAFFSCYLLLVAGAAGALWQRRLTPLFSSVFLVAVLSLGVLANLAPSLLYTYKHGPNADAVRRVPIEGEVCALKLTHLLLPVTGHRLGWLRGLKMRYDTGSPGLLHEGLNAGATLGLIGSTGFLILLARFLFRSQGTGRPSLLDCLATLTGFAVLLGTVGGFGSVFNFLATPLIRQYNRLSIFIAFFAFAAVALLLDRLAARHVRCSGTKLLFSALLGVLLVVGILDQTAPSLLPIYRAVKQEYRNDAEFVSRMEAELPYGASVFQLPCLPFPEGWSPSSMCSYDMLRGYVHSKTLRWSFGAMRGREESRWHAQAEKKPVGELVRTIAAAGFAGIYIDRWGYDDRGAALEAQLSNLLGSAPQVSANGRQAFFSLYDSSGRLRGSVGNMSLLPVFRIFVSHYVAEVVRLRTCRVSAPLPNSHEFGYEPARFR